MRVKRVLIVTEAADAWPSGYIRALIYKDLFASDGIQADYCSRLVPAITKLIVHPNRWVGRVMDLGLGRTVAGFNSLLAHAREARIVRQAKNYDAIYLQKVTSLPLVSALRRNVDVRLVYDLNDALWLPWMARFTGGSVTEILQLVDAVTCDNSHGLEFARRYSREAYLVHDPPQLELFDQYRQKSAKSDSTIVLGWVGSPTTVFNVYSIWESLETLFSRHEKIVLRLLGVGHDWRLLPRFEKVRYSVVPFYSQEEMVRQVLQMDLGLFPLFDTEDARARGILKATIYMSGEACVIASPIGDNCQLITDGVNGVFADTLDEWVERLTLLVEDVELRKRIARAGLQTVRERFTLLHCYNELKRALCHV